MFDYLSAFLATLSFLKRAKSTGAVTCVHLREYYFHRFMRYLFYAKEINHLKHRYLVSFSVIKFNQHSSRVYVY